MGKRGLSYRSKVSVQRMVKCPNAGPLVSMLARRGFAAPTPCEDRDNLDQSIVQ